MCLDTFSIIMVLDYISNHYDIWKITSLYGVSDIAKSEVITTTRNLQIYFKLVGDFYYKKCSGMNYLSTPIIFYEKFEWYSVLLQTLVCIYIYHNRIFQNNIWCFNSKQKLINCSQVFEVLFIDSVEKKEKMKRGMGWITFAYECITTCIRYLSLTW